MTKTALDNPALRHFQPRAATPWGPYAAVEAVILWDVIDGAVGAVTVAFFPALRIGAGHPLWLEWRRYCLQWDFAFGTISPGWMGCDVARPETVFWYFVSAGFASTEDQARAFDEFGRIRECGWAREFAARLGIVPCQDAGTPRRGTDRRVWMPGTIGVSCAHRRQ